MSSFVGGQAVIEGVMMRHKDKVAVAVRKPDKSISVKEIPFTSWTQKFRLFRQPLMRGSFILFETMILGMKALTFSANESIDEDDEKISWWGIATTILFSFALGIGFFIVLPLFLTEFLYSGEGFWFNAIDGVIRIAVFVLYIGCISLMKDMKAVFRYHGAEHKAVYCYEAKKPLTVENAQSFSKLHPRCGTTFVLLVLIISILIFSFITSTIWSIKFGVRLLLLPVIAGISFEIIRLGGYYPDNWLVKLLIAPGLLFQRLTTREPNDDEVEVAIKALVHVLPQPVSVEKN